MFANLIYSKSFGVSEQAGAETLVFIEFSWYTLTMLLIYYFLNLAGQKDVAINFYRLGIEELNRGIAVNCHQGTGETFIFIYHLYLKDSSFIL